MPVFVKGGPEWKECLEGVHRTLRELFYPLYLKALGNTIFETRGNYVMPMTKEFKLIRDLYELVEEMGSYEHQSYSVESYMTEAQKNLVEEARKYLQRKD